MDIATSLGLLAGVVVLATLILMGGDLRMFLDAHAAIVIFGGAFAATLIRFRFLRSSMACRLGQNSLSRCAA
jgi:chemotaxis protein MotA